MADKNSYKYANTPDCKVPIRGKYKRNIIELAKAFFRTRYRNTVLNRTKWRFDVHVVDAEAGEVKEFMQQNNMCFVENTFSSCSEPGARSSEKQPGRSSGRTKHQSAASHIRTPHSPPPTP